VNPEDEKTPDDVTEDDIPDMNAVSRICWHFWKMEPIDICLALGYKKTMDFLPCGLAPWDAWLTIRDLKRSKKN